MEGDRECVAESPVLEEGEFVVSQSAPAGRREQVVIGERQIERGKSRSKRQPEEADQPRREEKIARAVAPPGAFKPPRKGGRRGAAPFRRAEGRRCQVAGLDQARSSTVLALS